MRERESGMRDGAARVAGPTGVAGPLLRPPFDSARFRPVVASVFPLPVRDLLYFLTHTHTHTHTHKQAQTDAFSSIRVGRVFVEISALVDFVAGALSGEGDFPHPLSSVVGSSESKGRMQSIPVLQVQPSDSPYFG